MKTEIFEITEQHLALLKRICWSWDDFGYGAPCVNPKRPYGNSDVENDICEILRCKRLQLEDDEEAFYIGTDLEKAATIHREMQTVLQIITCTGQIALGKYIKQERYDCLSWTQYLGGS